MKPNWYKIDQYSEQTNNWMSKNISSKKLLTRNNQCDIIEMSSKSNINKNNLENVLTNRSSHDIISYNIERR